ncbi:unnamed protein product [Schistocephalus solidus]|uniref:Uncharacterized protein n=1 Tax=Schistocephalus solidus TaxID=70667 RepID=A0A183SBP8_SCHSO|nr:unnamed protein product [Schistocephalus solidus]
MSSQSVSWSFWCKKRAGASQQHAAAVVKTAGGDEGRTLLGVFGGENEGRRLSSCEVYDVSRDR